MSSFTPFRSRDWAITRVWQSARQSYSPITLRISRYAAFLSTIVLLFSASFIAPTANAADDPVSIVAVEPWGDVFGGKTVALHFTVASQAAMQARVGWVFAINGRAVSRGESPLELHLDKAANLEIKLDVPEVKPGVIMPAALILTATARADATRQGACEKRLWVYPPDPTVNRVEWLKSLNLRMFDPEKTTAPHLEMANIPFTTVGNIEALTEPGTEVLLIGEGVSFDDYRALPEIICRAAANGHPVLCLAPKGGMMSLPGTKDMDWPSPCTLSLRGTDIITELDKRLDAKDWPAGDAVITSLALTSIDNRVVGEVIPGHIGWPWLEMRYPDKNACVIFCGFGVSAQWDAGPTPRFLFVRLLDYLTGTAQINTPIP